MLIFKYSIFFHQRSTNLPHKIFVYRINRYDAILHVCFKEVMNMDGIEIPRTESIYQSLLDLGIDRNVVIPFATFSGQIAIFHPIFTGEGLCFTYNSINSMEIYSDEYE